MKKIKDLCSDTTFLFLLIEMILCLIGTIMVTDALTSYYSWRFHDILVVAVAGYLLITAAYILVYVMDEDEGGDTLKILLFITGGILNIVAGIFSLIHYMDGNKYYRNSNNLILAITTICCGVLMIIDTIKDIKS